MELIAHRHELGVSWTVKEKLARTSHALVDGTRVWIVDPVADESLMATLRELGDPVAVLQLLDRHNRGCAQVAAELGVPHVRLPRSMPDAPFEVIPTVWRAKWQEVSLSWPQRRALIVAEAVGTAPLFTLGAGRVGLHPILRLQPPQRLRGFDIAHLLVGHGPPLSGLDTTAELASAFDRARADILTLPARLPSLLKG